MLQLRDQVGNGDIDEAARGDDEQVWEVRLPRTDDEVADDAADDRRESGERIEEQRSPAREAGLRRTM
jgi:hypothetical protein